MSINETTGVILDAGSITITHQGDRTGVQCTLRRQAEGHAESIALSVTIPLATSRTVEEVQHAAILRAIELLHSVLSRGR